MSCIRLRSFAASTGNHLYGNGHIRQCYDFISSPCDPWQRRVLSAPFYAQPIKPFYTITYISPLHLSFFSSPTTLYDSWSGLVFWQPSPLMCSTPLSKPPIFMSHTQQKGCKAHRFHISQILCSQGEGPRLKRCTSAF